MSKVREIRKNSGWGTLYQTGQLSSLQKKIIFSHYLRIIDQMIKQDAKPDCPLIEIQLPTQTFCEWANYHLPL